jgi:hypothetical protein
VCLTNDDKCAKSYLETLGAAEALSDPILETVPALVQKLETQRPDLYYTEEHVLRTIKHAGRSDTSVAYTVPLINAAASKLEVLLQKHHGADNVLPDDVMSALSGLQASTGQLGLLKHKSIRLNKAAMKNFGVLFGFQSLEHLELFQKHLDQVVDPRKFRSDSGRKRQKLVRSARQQAKQALDGSSEAQSIPANDIGISGSEGEQEEDEDTCLSEDDEIYRQHRYASRVRKMDGLDRTFRLRSIVNGVLIILFRTLARSVDVTNRRSRSHSSAFVRHTFFLSVEAL